MQVFNLLNYFSAKWRRKDSMYWLVCMYMLIIDILCRCRCREGVVLGRGEDTGSITIHYDTWPSWDQDTPPSRHQDRLWNSDISQADNPSTSGFLSSSDHQTRRNAPYYSITSDTYRQTRLDTFTTGNNANNDRRPSECLVWHSQANTLSLLVIFVSHCHSQRHGPT